MLYRILQRSVLRNEANTKRSVNPNSLCFAFSLFGFIISLGLTCLVVGFDLGSRATLEFEWVNVLSDVTGFTHQGRDWYEILAAHYISTTIVFAILVICTLLRGQLIGITISILAVLGIVYFYFENFITVGKYSSFWVDEHPNSIYYGVIDFTSYLDILILFLITLIVVTQLFQVKTLLVKP